MKRLLGALVLLFIVFVVVCRFRLYIRDPFADVARSGGKEAGAQVYINYANDVLLENDNPPRYLELVQHGQHAGVPVKITCIHWLACLLDADVGTLVPGSSELVHPEVMNNRVVQFRDEKGETDVSLR